MTPLELLTIFSLYSNKPLLDSLDSSEFMTGPQIESLKADGKSAMIEILRTELGLEWDGNGMLSHFIVAEQRKVDRVKLAQLAFAERRKRLCIAELALMFPRVAGQQELDKALEELRA